MRFYNQDSSDEKVSNLQIWRVLLYFTITCLLSVVLIMVFFLCIVPRSGHSETDIFVIDAASVAMFTAPILGLIITDRFCNTSYIKLLIIRRDAINSLMLGTLAGAGLFCLMIVAAYLLQQVKFFSYDGAIFSYSTGLFYLGNSMIEEIVFRGVMFLTAEKIFGTLRAAVISTILFGSLHFFSGGIVNILTATAGGTLLCIIYIVSRNLWIVIGLHWMIDYLAVETFSGGSTSTSGMFHIQVYSGYPYINAFLQLFLAVIIFYLWRVVTKRTTTVRR